MHSYDRKYNYLTLDNGSCYTDSILPIVEALAAGNLRFVNTGYADRIYHDGYHDNISVAGTEIIRRTDGVADFGTALVGLGLEGDE